MYRHRHASDCGAYERLWASILSGARVRQCACGQSASCRLDVVVLEREGWSWRLGPEGRALWTCPDCRQCGATRDGLRCARRLGHAGVHHDEVKRRHFVPEDWQRTVAEGGEP